MELFQDFLFWDTLWQRRVEIGIDPYKLDSHVQTLRIAKYMMNPLLNALQLFTLWGLLSKGSIQNFKWYLIFFQIHYHDYLNVKIQGILKENFKTYHNHYALTAINLFVSYKNPVWFHLILFTTSVGSNTFLSVHCITDIHIS